MCRCDMDEKLTNYITFTIEINGLSVEYDMWKTETSYLRSFYKFRLVFEITEPAYQS